MNKIKPFEKTMIISNTADFDFKYLKINVRGYKYKIQSSLLDKYPSTRLGQLRYEENKLKLCDDYNLIKNEFYFNRDPFFFNQILNYFNTNQLHLNKNDCAIAVQNELDYWKIDESLIELCCKKRYDESFLRIHDYENKLNDIAEIKYSKHNFGKYFPNLRFSIWNLLTNSKSSLLARLVFILNVVFILFFPIETIVRTLPVLKNNNCTNSKSKNATDCIDIDDVIEKIGYGFISILAFESILVFISCPEKWKFIKSPLNLLDFVCIIPFFIAMPFEGDIHTNDFFLIVNIIRLFLLLKLFKYFTSLKLLMLTIKQSIKELLALTLFILISLVIFSSLLFYFEKVI